MIFNLFKSYSTVAWNGPSTQGNQWSSHVNQTQTNTNPWSNINLNHNKRPIGVPNLHPISPVKKSPPTLSQPAMLISPSKFRRSTSLSLKPFPSTLTSSGNGTYDLCSAGNDTQTSSSVDSSLIRKTNDILSFQVRFFETFFPFFRLLIHF